MTYVFPYNLLPRKLLHHLNLRFLARQFSKTKHVLIQSPLIRDDFRNIRTDVTDISGSSFQVRIAEYGCEWNEKAGVIHAARGDCWEEPLVPATHVDDCVGEAEFEDVLVDFFSLLYISARNLRRSAKGGCIPDLGST
jgi:hypothetical protein